MALSPEDERLARSVGVSNQEAERILTKAHKASTRTPDTWDLTEAGKWETARQEDVPGRCTNPLPAKKFKW